MRPGASCAIDAAYEGGQCSIWLVCGCEPEEAASLLHISYDDLQKGGYRIYTAMDQRMQSTAEAMFADAEKLSAKNASDGTVPQAAPSSVVDASNRTCMRLDWRKRIWRSAA